MRQWNRRWVLLALLGVLGVACLTEATDARRRFRRWWFRPPAPAIENSDYVGQAVGRSRSISVLDGEIISNDRMRLDEVEFTASVEEGSLLVDPIIFSATTSDETTMVDTTTTVEIVLDEASLIRTFFNSIFYTQGIATITVEETDNSVDPPEVTPGTPVEVPVQLFGSIHEHSDDGSYHLRGGIRGFLREEDEGTGEVNYTLISVRLNADGEPVEKLPE